MANFPVPTFDPTTGRLPDVVHDALGRDFSKHMVVNVYDYGAIDVSAYDVSTREKLDAVPSSQFALDLAIAAAEKLASTSAETRVWIQIPYGAVRGSIWIKTPYVCVMGPGALVAGSGTEGEVLVSSSLDKALVRFHTFIRDLTCKPLNAALFRGTCAVRVRGAAFVHVQGIRVRDLPVGVLFETWENLAGQQNKNITIGGIPNEFVNVDYAVKTNHRTGTTWDATADSWFFGNIVRNAYISHGYIEGADGFHAFKNAFFSVGRDSPDTFHKAMKSHGWYYGPRTAFGFFDDNEVFETGYSGVYLDRCASVQVRGNNFGWCGQIKQTPTVLINTTAAFLTGAHLVDGNTMDLCTGPGIGIIGDGNAGNILIPGSNNIRLMGDEQRNVYRGDQFGNGPLKTNDLAQIYVAPTVVGLPQVTHTWKPRGSRKSVIDMKGMYSSARRTPWPDHTETITNHTRDFTVGQGQTLCNLASTTDPVSATTYVGIVEVIAKNTDGSYVGRYEFTVASNGTNKTVANLRTAGSVSSIADGRTPAFVFSIPQAGLLTATAQGNTAGKFEFTVKAMGLVQASYTAAEFALLPLVETPSGT
ncbi:hypothetical protein EDF38_1320 [Frigoribacterium sp. PhB160]|uniref:hypothetical protein n=1 Tax=Frigoribacterium sp. PhB160 TaxID=2485192 RepID=UPI000F487FDE|nr:hypothetical protein [Frigoribacterium sp. PhB160]ROS62217.1 hypothetical protein EDF38_1320 [Frigoribacterium sp. PhB160]